ncbi:MAG: NAD-dependent dehydratase [bacterium (Candidatus Stahlbacteria) CG23_combo_of_CG06-09_8_20_14_all_34_7]|nr:MAG: NAD-dependent dehydratase [bacterium (Candidatus Stahlbacteria) CG23_combo_of_CG06-09_8_20_14_all_34_7]
MVKKRILVTGCAGFIGFNLCEELLQDNSLKVIGLDNFYTGREENVALLQKKKNFNFILHDIVHPIEIKADEIYHLASPASPVFYQKNPIKTLKTNFIGSMNILGMARKCKAKVLLSSTSEVYGDPLVHPQKENYWGNVNSIGIRACYDEGKRIAETLMFEYHRNHKIKIKVCRIFNTYGPFMMKNDGRVISNFINQALESKSLTIFGDGTQTRSFCYVSDMVNGIQKMMNSADSFTGPLNLGSDDERTIGEIAELIIKLTKSKSKIVFKKLPMDDPCKRKPDLTLAKKNLNFKAVVGFEEGLKQTISYFRSLR